MDTTERARLRALCEAATPGPWHVDEIGGVTVTTCDPGGRVGEYVAEVVWPIDEDGDEDGNPYAADVALIAASRTAIPALLDDLDAADARAVRAERERDDAVADASQWERLAEERKAALDGWRDDCARMGRERDEARAEVERLRASETERRELMPAVLDAVRASHRREVCGVEGCAGGVR